jgi:hypothetical protein
MVTRDLGGESGGRGAKFCDRNTLTVDENVAGARLDVNVLLHQFSPLQRQLQATRNPVSAYAWYCFGEKRIRIETPSIVIYPIPMLISSAKTEVMYGHE